MLEATGLACIRGARLLFKDVSFTASPGEFVQVAGPNGSGKTSLLRMLCGLAPPARGDIRWNGSSIRVLGEHYYSDVVYAGHRQGMKDELTAMENLRMSCGMSGAGTTEADTAAALQTVGLGPLADAPAQLLSEGQRRRLLLARLIVRKAPLWLLDEALTALDKAGVELAASLIDKHLETGGMAVFVTHQEFRCSSRIVRKIDLGS